MIMVNRVYPTQLSPKFHILLAIKQLKNKCEFYFLHYTLDFLLSLLFFIKLF